MAKQNRSAVLETDTQVQYEMQSSTPNPDLKRLDRLVGTWKQSGGVEGEITYEWTGVVSS